MLGARACAGALRLTGGRATTTGARRVVPDNRAGAGRRAVRGGRARLDNTAPTAGRRVLLGSTALTAGRRAPSDALLVRDDTDPEERFFRGAIIDLCFSVHYQFLTQDELESSWRFEDGYGLGEVEGFARSLRRCTCPTVCIAPAFKWAVDKRPVGSNNFRNEASNSTTLNLRLVVVILKESFSSIDV